MIGGFGRDTDRAGLTVGELRAVLDHLQQLCAAAGAKAAAIDLTIFSEMLAPYANTSVTVFVDDIHRHLREASKPKKSKTKSPSAKPKSITNDAAIARYVAELRDAAANRATFEAVFDRLKADKSLKATDVGEIAHQYASSVTKHKSMKAAHEEISKAFVRQARFENKLK